MKRATKTILNLVLFILISLHATCFQIQLLSNQVSSPESTIEFPQTQAQHPRLLQFDLAAHGLIDVSTPHRMSYFSIPKINSPNPSQNYQNSQVSSVFPPQSQTRISQDKETASLVAQTQNSYKNIGSPTKILSNNEKNANDFKPSFTESPISPRNRFPQPQANEPLQAIHMINGPFMPNEITYIQTSNAFTWEAFIYQDISTQTEDMKQQIRYYQQKYNIGSYSQLPFCIVVPTFNNKQKNRYINNIKSILMQNYSNYHIVVIDDASTDGTGELISAILKDQTKLTQDRYLVVRNQREMKAMPNLRKAALEYCQPKEIFLVVDGDDFLLGRQVLKLFNANFQKKDAWFVYSNYIVAAKKSVGFCKPFPQEIKQANNYRHYPLITSHLRAFYTQLFRNIRDQDLRDQKGEYLRAANDVAICMPILQQSRTHVHYIPEITYFYNDNTGLNNHIIRFKEQQQNEKKVRRKPQYTPLERPFQRP